MIVILVRMLQREYRLRCSCSTPLFATLLTPIGPFDSTRIQLSFPPAYFDVKNRSSVLLPCFPKSPWNPSELV